MWSNWSEQQAKPTSARKVAFLDEEGTDQGNRASAEGPAQIVSTTLVGLVVVAMVGLCLVHGHAIIAAALER